MNTSSKLYLSIHIAHKRYLGNAVALNVDFTAYVRIKVNFMKLTNETTSFILNVEILSDNFRWTFLLFVVYKCLNLIGGCFLRLPVQA